jgi:uncharacterized surface protein with fasciclin (FAS1) repeats
MLTTSGAFEFLDGSIDLRTNWTLFAPTDQSISALGPDETNYYTELYQNPIWENHLICFLLYHIGVGEIKTGEFLDGSVIQSVYELQLLNLSSNPPSVNSIPLFNQDLLATNGVVHVINQEPLHLPCTRDSIFTQGTLSADHSLLVGLVEQAGLQAVLTNDLPITLFAPTDSAISSLPDDLFLFLVDPANVEQLKDILRYHILPDLLFLNDAASAGEYATSASKKPAVTVTFDTTFRGNFTIQGGIEGNIALVEAERSNLLAKNGIIHVIDQVLLPPGITIPEPTSPPAGPVIRTLVDILLDYQPPLTIFNTMILAADITQYLDGTVDVGDNFTIFTPTDGSFQAFGEEEENYFAELYLNPIWENHLACFLTYHIAIGRFETGNFSPGQPIPTVFQSSPVVLGTDPFSVNQISLYDANLLAENGVVHIISQEPLLHPCVRDSIFTQVSFALDTLAGLIQASGLEQVLSTESPLTMFVPTNEAFAALSPNVLAFLSDSANVDQLQDVLRYHVLSGMTFLENATSTGFLATTALEEPPIFVDFNTTADEIFTVTGGTDDNVAIVQDSLKNILAKNGVLHVIDQVLLPPEFTVPSEPVAPSTAATVFPSGAPLMVPIASPVSSPVSMLSPAAISPVSAP